MFHRARLFPAVIGALILASPVAAETNGVTLVNRDAKDHKLTLIEEKGAKTTDHVLKPSQVLEGVCTTGCVVRINDSADDEYELEVGDKVSIEEGLLYYDEPEASQTGGAAATSPAAPEPKKN